MTLRVVVADDQPIVLAGLAALLDAEPDLEVVGRAENGRRAVDLVRSLRPDVALLDIRMPELDGIGATREIGAATAVVIITTFDTDGHVHAALRAGARGFLLKGAPREQLADAVRIAARGDALIDPAVTARLLAHFASTRPRPPEPLDALTAREEDVLALVAGGRTNAEIAGALHIGLSTVKFHLAGLMTKLAVRNRVELAMWAHETGRVR